MARHGEQPGARALNIAITGAATHVPEPGSLLLTGAGMLALVARRKKRAK